MENTGIVMLLEDLRTPGTAMLLKSIVNKISSAGSFCLCSQGKVILLCQVPSVKGWDNHVVVMQFRPLQDVLQPFAFNLLLCSVDAVTSMLLLFVGKTLAQQEDKTAMIPQDSTTTIQD
jgi:hypothetical protein